MKYVICVKEWCVISGSILLTFQEQKKLKSAIDFGR